MDETTIRSWQQTHEALRGERAPKDRFTGVSVGTCLVGSVAMPVILIFQFPKISIDTVLLLEVGYMVLMFIAYVWIGSLLFRNSKFSSTTHTFYGRPDGLCQFIPGFLQEANAWDSIEWLDKEVVCHRDANILCVRWNHYVSTNGDRTTVTIEWDKSGNQEWDETMSKIAEQLLGRVKGSET